MITPISDSGPPRKAVEKALALFTELQVTPGPIRLSELSRRTGLAKSTTHRMLCALVSSGAVTKVGDRYQVSGQPRPGARSASAVGLRATTLRTLAPYVSELHVRTKMTASLAVLHGADVVFVYRVYSHSDVWSRYDDAGQGVGYRAAAGRVLMAYDHQAMHRAAELSHLSTEHLVDLTKDLDRIRRERIAVNRTVGGTTCVAVPMLGVQGHPRIALAVRGVTGRIEMDQVVRHLRDVASSATNAVLRRLTRPPGETVGEC